MKVYIENIFLLDFDMNKNINLEEEEFNLQYDTQNILYDEMHKTELNGKSVFVLYKKRSFGYEIYLICPNYLENDELDGIEIVEREAENILPSKLLKIFKDKFENYNGEYLFHQYIIVYDKHTFDINQFLSTHFILQKIEWSKYLYIEDNGINKDSKDSFCLNILLSIDNFILQRHVMYEFFSREYLKMMSQKIGYKNYITKNNSNIKFLNQSRLLIFQHKLLMENFGVKIINFIESNKLFEKHKVIRKKEIFEKIKEDLDNYITTSQQNFNNFIMILLAIIGIIATVKFS